MNQNEKGMTPVWSVLVFGPLTPYYETVAADSSEEAVSIVRERNPTQYVSGWVERDTDVETKSKEIVLDALEQAAYDAYQDVSKRKNGRV